MNLEKDLRVVFGDQIKDYESEMSRVLKMIGQSRDPNKNNYLPQNFNLKDQEEITLLMLNERLVAFSTLFRRNIFPDQTSRALNRFWKDPEIRFVDRPYWVVSRKMLLPQIEKARKLGKKAIFISVQGERSLWLKRWVKEANSDLGGWEIAEGMRKVAGGDDPLCWQNVAYLALEENYTFELPHKTYEEWESEYREFLQNNKGRT